MFQRGWFFVEASEARIAKQVVRIVQRYGVVRAGVVDDASAALLREPGRVAGAILAVADPAQMLEAVARVRSHAPALPVLALLSVPTPQLLNALQSQGVEASCLPVHQPSIVSFTQRALSAACLPHAGVARAVAQLAEERALSAREVQLLSYALADDPRACVRRRLGVEENTLKSQIRSLLHKCGARNLDALAKNVLRSAVLERAGALVSKSKAAYDAAPMELACSA